MRRLTILLATVGALLLVPAAQAFANGTLHVEIAGTGTGEASSVEGFSNFFKGTPPIECAGPPSTGICETELEEFEGEPGEFIGLHAHPDPGSEFAGWVVTEGEEVFCIEEENHLCLVGNTGSTGEDATVIAIFECETEGGCAAPLERPMLTLTKEGTGSGTVVSNPAGIECGNFCTKRYPRFSSEGPKVVLTASPSAGSLFVSWKGCDKGGANGRQCTVTLSEAKNVSAKFTLAYDVTVNRVGSGLGKVSSSPGGVLCLSNCSSTTAAFKEGTSVTLTAAPTKNYVFTEWTGDCSGSSLTCSLGSLGANKTVGAKFTAVPQFNLQLKKAGGGNGTVKSNVAGINCGATCSSMVAAYFQGTVVELTATPGKGSTFGGWSGGSCSGTGICTVAMSDTKVVTAAFK